MSSFQSLPVPAQEFAGSLLSWYDRNRRALPWRDDPHWYRVWISEIMLQQTTVKAVVPYFNAFLSRFPDVQTLATAREADVLALWAGLGYYTRARHLHEAARIICSRFGGTLPADYRAVLALPGIGRYTAGAILSIAFGLPYPVVDGNVRRVLARYTGFMAAWTSNSTRALWDLLTEVVNHQAVVARVGDFNQALMELGATVCTQRNSNCERCPLASSCVARRLSMQDSLPRRRPARPSVVLDCVVVLLRQGERILMHVNRDGPFPRDLWELPRITGLPDRDLEQHFAKEHGLLLKVGTVVKTVAHLITHHRIRIHVVEASLQHTSIPDEYRWIDPNEPEVGLSGYVRKVLRGLAHPVHAAAD